MFRTLVLGYSAKAIILNSFELMEPFRKLMKPMGFHPQGEKINACLHIYTKHSVTLQIPKFLGVKNNLSVS